MSSSKAFPGFSHIYSLTSSGSDEPFRARLELPKDRAFSVLRGETELAAPIQARWKMGSSKPGDVIFTTLALPLLISDRIRQRLSDAGYSGWDVVPVDLIGKFGERLPTYYFFCVTGRCGPIDDGMSERIEKAKPARVVPYLRGLYFEPSTWDGSDVFMAPEKGYKFFVEPVKDAIEEFSPGNVFFTALDEVEREDFSRSQSKP